MFETMLVDAEHLQLLECAKEFASTSNINYADYSYDGCILITANDSETIELYNAQNGIKEKTTVVSKKYGLGCVKFVHESKTDAVHTSTKLDNHIRHVVLHGSKYVRYFKGHTKTVTGLSMSPVSKIFLSTSEDNSIRLWDIRTDVCQGMVHCQGRTVGAFDPDGIIFAAADGPGKMKLYDLRTFDKGSFLTIRDPEFYNNVRWTSLEFSPCGKIILVNTNEHKLYLFDAFTGEKMHMLDNIENNDKQGLQATFTPNSQFIWCGSSDGLVHCWETRTGKHIVSKKTNHKGMVKITRWNPRFFSMVTAGSSLNFWVSPDDEI